MSLKITVAIPTVAGRAGYLASALETCTSQRQGNLEILISDNSAGHAEAVALRAGDPRIRYVRPPHYLTMAAHWEFLLQHVSGDSLTIIGDDDGLMPGAIGKVSTLLGEQGNVPIHHSLCNYFWPDYPKPVQQNSVEFMHAPFDGGVWIKSTEFLHAVASGRSRYHSGPMLYHNFIPVPLVRRIAGLGLFFRRAIPDVYSALAIAANCDRFYSAGQYLTIAGQGAKSNGAQVQEGGDGTAFNTKRDPPWHTPRNSSRTTPFMMIDSLTEVAEHFNRPDLADAIEYLPLLEQALAEASVFRGIRPKARELGIVGRVALERGVALELASWFIRRSPSKIARNLGLMRRRRRDFPADFPEEVKLEPDVTNIAEAANAVDRLMRQLSIRSGPPPGAL